VQKLNQKDKENKMIFKTKTIAELKSEIAEQQKKISKQKLSSSKTSETIKLQRQLFELKNKRLIEAGKKAKRLSERFGRGLLAAGKKAIPIIKKQAKLIREQQLRDDAIVRRLKKRKPSKKKSKSRKRTLSSDVFSNLDF